MDNRLIETVAIASLQPWAGNARNHPKRQLQHLRRSIERFRILIPIVIDENNAIVAGHARVAPAKDIGIAAYGLYRQGPDHSRAAGIIVTREGYGTGESLGGGTIGEAHERALKMAETDATKRALATFGKPFGLGLYLSARRTPETKISTQPIPDQSRRRTYQRLGSNGRYYVPIRPSPPIDPALAEAQADTTSQSNLEIPAAKTLPATGPEDGAIANQEAIEPAAVGLTHATEFEPS